MNHVSWELAIPAACIVVGVVGFVGWVMPWVAGRALAVRMTIITYDVHAEQKLRNLPSEARSVQALLFVLERIARSPVSWQSACRTELEEPDGVPGPLSPLEQSYLDRYVRRTEGALVSYNRQLRLVGGRVPVMVGPMVAMISERKLVQPAHAAPSFRPEVIQLPADSPAPKRALNAPIDLTEPRLVPERWCGPVAKPFWGPGLASSAPANPARSLSGGQ